MDSKIQGGKALPMSVARRDVSARTAGAISAAKGGYAIADTSTTAKVGDFYRAETATTASMVGKEYLVIDASTNSFTIASKELPTLGDTFYILSPVTLRVASDGSLSATISGSATEAKQDTMITSLQLLDDAVSTTGSAVPAKGFQVTGTDGTNARALKTDSSGELQIDVLSSALPSGAATEAKQDTEITALGTLDTSVNTLLKPADTLAAVTVVDTVTTVTTVGAVTAISNALPAGDNNIGNVDLASSIPAGTNNIGDVDILSIAAGDNNIGNVDVVTLPSIPAGTNNIGDVDVLTLPVAYDAGTSSATTQRVVSASGATATLANVDDTASSTTLLAASTSRLGATFFNDSTASLYLKFGATASTTSFTVLIPAQGYYELPGPNIYNGIIDGIWASDASGACRVTSW